MLVVVTRQAQHGSAPRRRRVAKENSGPWLVSFNLQAKLVQTDGVTGISGAQLCGVRGFGGLSAEQLDVLARYVHVEEHARGSSFATPQPSMAILLAGSAAVMPAQGRRVTLAVGTPVGATSLWADQDALRLSVVETSTIGVLTRQQFESLASEHPQVALRLLRGLLGESAGGRGTSSVAFGRVVTVRLADHTRSVPVGTLLGELLDDHLDHLPVVAGLVDQKATSLSTAVTTNCSVAPLTTSSWEGQRILRRSLALLAVEAARAVAPDVPIKMGPSVGFGQRIVVGRPVGLDELGGAIERRMRELVQSQPRLLEEYWPVDEAKQYFVENGWAEAEQLLGTWRDSAVPVVSYGKVFAIDMGPIVPDTTRLGEFYLISDENMLLLVYGRRPQTARRPTLLMPAIALSEVGEGKANGHFGTTHSFLLSEAHANGAEEFEEQAWLRTMGATGVGSFNRACISASVPELIRVAEAFHEKRMTLIADEVVRRRDDIDIVCIAGPSSSGKTTFIRRLCVQLKVNGVMPVALGLDDYYVDRVLSPRDATGDYDFEALGALQLELLHEHIARLLAGEAVRTARYDFKAGKSDPTGGRTIALADKDVLLIEGIHALNPLLLGSVPAARVYRVFVCPLMQLSFDHASRVHASDVRLIRRIVRDRRHRGHDAAQTIARWPKVRAGERRHIYPFQSHADAVFDTSLVYELSVLRVYAERYLLEVPRHDPAYTTASRLMQLLDRFVSIYPDHVPPTSILREFIGGSGFEY